MVSSLSHFSQAVGFKDKDGLCSEGLIDQNNCASICLLKAERTTASQRWYFQLFQPLMLLTWLVLMCWLTALQASSTAETETPNWKEHGYWCAGAKMKRKRMWIYDTRAVKAGKLYSHLCVSYFRTGNGDVFWWYPIYSDGCSSAMMTSMIWWQTATTTAPSVRTPGICIFQPKRVIHKRCNISLWNHQFHERGHKIAINLTSNNSHPPRPPTRKGALSSSAEITTCSFGWMNVDKRCEVCFHYWCWFHPGAQPWSAPPLPPPPPPL